MDFTWGKDEAEDGTHLEIGLRYGTHPKVWTFAALKAGGYWYLTGTGRVPQAAGWGAVARWASADGRSVVFVRRLEVVETLWAEDGSHAVGTDDEDEPLGPGYAGQWEP
jgi:hypothetical protein